MTTVLTATDWPEFPDLPNDVLWAPLAAVVPDPEDYTRFMFMGRSDVGDDVIYAYKHHRTRRAIHLGASGTVYRYRGGHGGPDGSGGFEPLGDTLPALVGELTRVLHEPRMPDVTLPSEVRNPRAREARVVRRRVVGA